MTAPLDVRAMLREAALTAFVVLMLAIVMVGLRLEDIPNALIPTRHFADVLAMVLIAFFGRMALVLLRAERRTAVMIVAGLVAIALLIGLLAETLFGTETAVRIAQQCMPFQAPVIQWCLFGAAAYLSLRAALVRRPPRDVADREAREAKAERFSAGVQRAARLLGPLLILAAALFPFAFWERAALMSAAIFVVMFMMLGWGLNIVVGLAGLLDLGYAAFFAVGAYSYALFATTPGLEWGFWICLPLAGMFAASAGVLLGFPVLRLRGDYLAIVTLGFGEIIRVVATNWQGLTNGPNGISGVPRPSLLGLSWLEEPPAGETSVHQFLGLEYNTAYEGIFLYYLVLLMALIVNLFTMRVRRLPIGRAWEALREDEIACRALGINPTNTKLTAFGLGAMFAGFAGAFFATNVGHVSPNSFSFQESAIVLAIVVLGGFGSQLGVVLAAIILIGLPELFRELSTFRMLAFGLAMVAIMLWRPAGLLAHREPTVRLAAARGKK